MTNLLERIMARLRRGPASEISLARFCDLPQTRKIRPFLVGLCARGVIHFICERYWLGIPAERITIGRGYRWLGARG